MEHRTTLRQSEESREDVCLHSAAQVCQVPRRQALVGLTVVEGEKRTFLGAKKKD